MSPAHVLEPTYATLRRRLLIGFWPSGFRLEAARLAIELGVSITPVRDSLNRLAGERLVLAASGEGFRVLKLDETEFRALLDWHLALIRMAVGNTPAGSLGIDPPVGHDGIAERTGLLFATIATLASNREIDWAVANAAARLGGYRRWEATILAGVEDELDMMARACREGDMAHFSELVEAHHRRRKAATAELVHRAHNG